MKGPMIGMGFRRKQIHLKDFTGELEGLEVVMRRMPMDDFLVLGQMDLDRDSVGITDQDVKTIQGIREMLASVLVSWNLEDDEPVPATLEGMRTLDMGMMTAIQEAYITAIAGVPTPLSQDSNSGDTSLVESIPMEALSANPTS
jgi:hypothetical protein